MPGSRRGCSCVRSRWCGGRSKVVAAGARSFTCVVLLLSLRTAAQASRGTPPILLKNLIESGSLFRPADEPWTAPRPRFFFYGGSPYYLRRPSQPAPVRSSLDILRRVQDQQRLKQEILQEALQEAKQEAMQEAVLPEVSAVPDVQGRQRELIQDVVMGESLGLGPVGDESGKGGDFGMGARAAMLRDRPGRSCSGSAQCRRKVDSSLNLLMRMMETGRRR